MEIRDRKPVQSAAAVRKRAAVARAPAAAAAGSAAARDVVSVGGVPEAELTPNVRRAITQLMAEVEQVRHELQEARQRIDYLEKLVDQDPLMPSVYNRRAFVRELTRMMAFAHRYGVPASLVYFDVNNMKHINDAHGHAAGDAALVTMAQALVENVRTTDVVGRLGGDEMGVLLVQTDQELANHKAAELAARIEARETLWQGKVLHVTVAYGAHAFAHGDSAGEVIEAADRAMYSQKSKMKQGRA